MNYLSRYILIAVVLFVPQLSFCQYQNKLFDIDSSADFGSNIKLRSDGSLFILGNANKYGGINIGTLVLTGNGQSQLQKHFIARNLTSYSFPNYGVLKTASNGQYLCPINILNPSSQQNTNTANAALMRLTANGDTVFIKGYTDTAINKELMLDITIAGNGDIIMGGNRRAPNTYAISSGLIIRTDSNGNIKWEHTYQKAGLLSNHHIINSIEALPDGRLLVCAVVIQHVIVSSLFDYDRKTPWVFLTDSSGNIVKERFFPTRYGGNTSGVSVYKDANGGYLMYGSLDSFVVSDPLAFSNFPHYIAHLDTNFNETWLTPFANPHGFYEIKSVKQLANNEYLLMGDGSTDTNYNYWGWVVRLKANGTIRWWRTYSNDTNYNAAIADGIERADGSIVLVGSGKNGTNPQWPQADVWILGVDANGCAVPGCMPTSVPSVPLDDKGFKLYPNPTTGLITIESAEEGILNIVNIQGQQVANFKIDKGRTRLQLPAPLSSGLYLGRFTGKENGNGVVLRIVYSP